MWENSRRSIANRRKRMKMKISGGGAKRLRVAWDGGKVNPAMEMSHKGEKREEKGERRKKEKDN